MSWLNEKKIIRFGFTLVEAIIYIAIVSIALTAIIGFALNISNIKTKSVVMSEVQYNAGFIEDNLKRLVVESGGLDEANSVFNNDSDGVLAILPASGLGASKRIVLNSATKRLVLDTDFLSTARVNVEKFRLTKISTTTVGVILDLAFKSPLDSGPYFQASATRDFILEFKR